MFYAATFDQALRFGDILQGYPAATPVIEKPFSETAFEGCTIDIAVPKFTVVMDPSCEIRDKTISLSPLIQVQRKFFDNPYFSSDLTRINRQMKPTESMSPNAWAALNPEQQQEKLKVEQGFALLNFFIFEKHDLFQRYPLKWRDKPSIETNYYMVDFRNTSKVNCASIQTPEKCPLYSKVLQLSTTARVEFAKKITSYYARIQLEDQQC